jgi:hypothetical protein
VLRKYDLELKATANFNHRELVAKTGLLKWSMLEQPIAPFVDAALDDYYFVVDPEGIFYTEDKRNSCVILKPFAQTIMSRLAQLCKIVVFTRKRVANVEPFIKEMADFPLAGVLDRSYEAYRSGRRIKDL